MQTTELTLHRPNGHQQTHDLIARRPTMLKSGQQFAQVPLAHDLQKCRRLISKHLQHPLHAHENLRHPAIGKPRRHQTYNFPILQPRIPPWKHDGIFSYEPSMVIAMVQRRYRLTLTNARHNHQSRVYFARFKLA